MLRWLDLTGRPVTHVKYGCILCFPFAYVAEIGRFSFNFGPDFEAVFFFPFFRNKLFVLDQKK